MGWYLDGSCIFGQDTSNPNLHAVGRGAMGDDRWFWAELCFLLMRTAFDNQSPT